MKLVEPLWTAREIAVATEGRTTGRWFAEGVAIDSREVIPGDLFVALAGTQTDGHRFVRDAIEAGAAGALVDRPIDGLEDDDPHLVRVADTGDALSALASAARHRVRGPVAVVTGSAGKTSVKEALRLALGRQALAHASVRSFNNRIGAPLSLARMPRAAQYAVFELGMNAAGEIGPLSRLIRPEIAIVTTVGPAHAEFFDSDREIAEAKAEVFEGLSPGGVAILDIDHAFADLLIERAEAHGLRVVTTSLDNDRATVRPVRLRLGTDASYLTAKLGDTLVAAKIGVPGRHWIANALLVLAAVDAMGGDLGLAGLALAEIKAPAGRGVRLPIRLPGGNALLIDDSYNANPLSISAAFAGLAVIPSNEVGRRLVVLADMEELGERALRLHLELAPALRAVRPAIAFTIGPNMAAMAEAAGVECEPCADAAAALEAVVKQLRPGDVVLVKGANKAGLSHVADGLLALHRGGEPTRNPAQHLAAQ